MKHDARGNKDQFHVCPNFKQHISREGDMGYNYRKDYDTSCVTSDVINAQLLGSREKRN